MFIHTYDGFVGSIRYVSGPIDNRVPAFRGINFWINSGSIKLIKKWGSILEIF